MKEFFKRLFLAASFIPSLSANFYSPPEEPIEIIETSLPKQIPPINYLAVQEKIESKKIPVLMFHKIGWNEDRYTISPNNFRNIIKNLHKNNFYLLNLEKFSRGDFSDIPVGKKPVLLTFDDAGEGQFEYLPGTTTINPNTAVGILEDYGNTFPDFGKAGVFFISYSDDKHNFRVPFIQENSFENKIKFLVSNNYDIGWHTPFHSDNSKSDISDINEQKIILDALIYKCIEKRKFEKMIKSYAHPFGAVPKNKDVKDYLLSQYDIVMDAWGGKSPHPLSKKFDVKKIPRIETNSSNINSVIHSSDNYDISFQDSLYYSFMFNGIETPFIRGFEEHHSKKEFFKEHNNQKAEFY